MKRNLLFVSVLAFRFLTGCSQEEIALNDENNSTGGGDTMVSLDVASTRVATSHKDGTEIENNVTKVRFYFFNEVGGAVNVKLQNGSYVNYYGRIRGDRNLFGDTNNNEDIKSKIRATIVINTVAGGGIPQRISDVPNPTYHGGYNNI